MSDCIVLLVDTISIVMKESDAVLCMFSGGIDSTGVLHRLLNEHNYRDKQLILHHIHLHSRENRALAESIAVKNILEYYKKNSDQVITITESTFDSTGFRNLKSNKFPFDTDIQGFIAANICISRPDIGAVAFGRTKTDIKGLKSGFVKRMLRLQHVFDAVLLNEPKPHPRFIYPVASYSKEEIWSFLPSEVKRYVWWCRRPVYKKKEAIPCRKCITCRDVLAFHDF